MKDEIRDAVAQWLAKADVDWTTVEILSTHPAPPVSAICFHCQQYVEKLLKAFLTVYQIEAPRTHDLRRLIELAAPILPVLVEFSDRVDALSVHGVDIRYPDNWRTISKLELQEMLALTDDFAAILLPVLKDYKND